MARQITGYMAREAARIGRMAQVEAIVDDWTSEIPVAAWDCESERRAREIRRENIRRTQAAS